MTTTMAECIQILVGLRADVFMCARVYVSGVGKRQSLQIAFSVRKFYTLTECALRLAVCLYSVLLIRQHKVMQGECGRGVFLSARFYVINFCHLQVISPIM